MFSFCTFEKAFADIIDRRMSMTADEITSNILGFCGIPFLHSDRKHFALEKINIEET